MRTFLDKHSFGSWLVYLLAGSLVSLCLSLGVGVSLLAIRMRTQIPIQTPTHPVTQTPINVGIEEPLNRAEQALSNYSPEKVKEILFPLLTDLQTPDDFARAHRLLGDAEFMQDHYELAAGYYEMLFTSKPTAGNLFLVASTYDVSGDLERAYQKYDLLIHMQGEEADSYRDEVEERLQYLTDVLKHRHDGTLPAPLPTFTPQTTP